MILDNISGLYSVKQTTEVAPSATLLRTMSCLLWNCWGLMKSRAVHALDDLRETKINMLSETKLRKSKIYQLRLTFSFSNYFVVDMVSERWGLAFLWQEGVVVSLVNFSVGHVDVRARGWWGIMIGSLQSLWKSKGRVANGVVDVIRKGGGREEGAFVL